MTEFVRRFFLVLPAILLSVLFPTSTVAQECKLDDPDRFVNNPALYVGCLAAELKRSNMRIAALEKELKPFLEAKQGAVIAFDRADECPTGWAKFEEGAGRFIIGVDGSKYKLPYVAGKPEYVTGGAEKHKLTIDEMPSHDHKPGKNYNQDPKRGFLVGGKLVGNITKDENEKNDYLGELKNIDSDSVGKGHPHNNMPPYIALYFCKKD